MNKVKNYGQVYTPHHIVTLMLDSVGYAGESILGKHIIDHSAGEGAFLIEIVKRYIEQAILCELSREQIAMDLETYIHGIEIQESVYQKLIGNLDKLVSQYHISAVHWNIICGDALLIDVFNKQMDFVVGNPPYVRIHNLNNSELVKKFRLCGFGMTDLYLVFYELGFHMMSDTGKMALITPSSWLHSKAGLGLRRYILNQKNCYQIIDFEHEQLFDRITTFVLIALFDNQYGGIVLDYNGNRIGYAHLAKYDSFILGSLEQIQLFEAIEQHNLLHSSAISVKNGFATLADKVFIQDAFDFQEEIIRPVYKASQGKWKEMIFPYDDVGNQLSLDTIQEKFPKTYYYLKEHQSLLETRSLENKSLWWLFGRSQAIKEIGKRKLAINTIVKDKASLKLEEVSAGSGVYSGLYIDTHVSLARLTEVMDDDFFKYIALLRKYKSGGYYTYSANDLRKYLAYRLEK